MIPEESKMADSGGDKRRQHKQYKQQQQQEISSQQRKKSKDTQKYRRPGNHWYPQTTTSELYLAHALTQRSKKDATEWRNTL